MNETAIVEHGRKDKGRKAGAAAWKGKSKARHLTLSNCIPKPKRYTDTTTTTTTKEQSLFDSLLLATRDFFVFNFDVDVEVHESIYSKWQECSSCPSMYRDTSSRSIRTYGVD